jgi:hypothetical protein
MNTEVGISRTAYCVQRWALTKNPIILILSNVCKLFVKYLQLGNKYEYMRYMLSLFQEVPTAPTADMTSFLSRHVTLTQQLSKRLIVIFNIQYPIVTFMHIIDISRLNRNFFLKIFFEIYPQIKITYQLMTNLMLFLLKEMQFFLSRA